MYKTVIIDVDSISAQKLKEYIDKHCLDIKMIKVFTNYYEAVQMIEVINPEIIFLDIFLGKDKTGFDLLETLKTIAFQTIFTSCNLSSCIKAYDYGHVGFVLTPFKPSEVAKSRRRAVQRIQNLDYTTKELEFNKHIAVSNGRELRVLKIADILFCASNGNYSVFHMANSEKIMALKNLGYFEGILPKDRFFRIHKKYLVNINYVHSIHRTDGTYCKLLDKTTLSISRRKHEVLLRKLKYK